MLSTSKGKFIGSSFIVIGTMVGAGMLAMPLVSSGTTFAVTAIILVGIFVISTITALLTLEVNLAFPEYANSLGTMASKTLGVFGRVVTWICTLLILYALVAAYIAGNASLLTELIDLLFHIKVPGWLNAVAFTLIMGGVIYLSTKAVDYCNRFLLSIKGLFLLATLILLAPKINFVNLVRDTYHEPYVWTMIPIFICSFGFHTVIPSLTNYIGRKPYDLKMILLSGASITFIIYLLWLITVLGVIPWAGANSFTSLAASNNSVGELIRVIYLITNNSWVTASINGFSNIAMTTSFLGVALGLFDFLADGAKRPNTYLGRFQTFLLTFIPPLAFALFFPNGFILALKYAAFFATILILLLPPLMAYKLRKSKSLSSPYKVWGGNKLLISIIAVTSILIIIQVLIGVRILP